MKKTKKFKLIKSSYSAIDAICIFAIILVTDYFYETLTERQFTYKNIFISELDSPFAFWAMITTMALIGLFALFGFVFIEFETKNNK